MGVWEFITKGRRIAIPLAEVDRLLAPEAPGELVRKTRVINLQDLDNAVPTRASFYNGDKFPGGFGVTKLFTLDYWTLRARSAQLWRSNLYARGMIRRLITNVINTGLHLECTPEAKLLGLPPDGLSEWSEDIEVRFALWGLTPRLCDVQQRLTFGELQAAADQEAMVVGDVLVMLVQNADTGLPAVRLVNGANVNTPLDVKVAEGHKVRHGVELDAVGRHVGFWVRQEDGKSNRVPAFDSRGRRIAWLHYGCDKRYDDVRGEPLLGLILQSLKEIDDYRDATQRKAKLLAMITAWVEKTEDKPGSKSLTAGGGAVRRGLDTAADSTGTPRSFQTAELVPGLVMEEMQQGEKVHAFQTSGTVETFPEFEAAMVYAMAWSEEIPPEILTLSFKNNYSASKAAINEFQMFLDPRRARFGQQFCQPIFEDWMLSSALNQDVVAKGFLEAWRDPRRHVEYAAWLRTDWTGHIKPAIDLPKQVGGYKLAISEGLMTRAQAARELFGRKYSKIVAQLRLENEQLADANEPLLPPEPPAPPGAPPGEGGNDDDEEATATPLELNDNGEHEDDLADQPETVN